MEPIPADVDELLRRMGERSLREMADATGAMLIESELTPDILYEAGLLWRGFYAQEIRLLGIVSREALAQQPNLGKVLEAFTTRVIGLRELDNFLKLPAQQSLQILIAENTRQLDKLREVLNLFVALDELR